jgi:putative colanic acid biosynthesis acetyltransferase WcaF
MNNQVNNSNFNNSWYYPGRNYFVRIVWYIVNSLIFNSYLFPFYQLKIRLLKLFGARVGIDVIIKPKVSIKYPWNLYIGSFVWIGENVWIDNLDQIMIGDNVCISQGAMLLTGNHDYSKNSFDLICKPITLENGVWIGAKSVVCPGVICKSHSVLTVGSIATKDLAQYFIYQGVPALPLRKREIK